MDSSEYIETVVGQIRCKRARAAVSKELSDHIEDQTEDYLHQGMSEEEAKSEAVRQMGDAVEVGTELDRLHRPRMDKYTLIMIAVLSMAAFLLQSVVIRAIRGSGTATALRGRMVLPQILVGIALMIVILYVDYTILGKHPLIPWIILLVAAIAYGGSGWKPIVYIHMIGGRTARWIMYLLIGCFLPAFVGVIYHFRTKGWKGLAISVLLLFAQTWVYMQSTGQLSVSLIAGFAGLLLISYALWKGWYGKGSLWALWGLWGTVIGAIGLKIASVLKTLFIDGYVGYEVRRIEAFLNTKNDPQGWGYIPFYMRKNLENIELLGRSSHFEEMPIESANSFFVILVKWGIIPGILIAFLLLALFFFMAKGVAKQKNVLGSLLGMACVLGLAIPTVGHILSCLSLIPYTDVFIPFLYQGWVANLASYTLLGLYLSVYRYKDVVA